jgi:hypothetical protein
MNKSLVAITVALAIAGCSSTPKVDTVREEVLSTSFQQESIKVQTNCRWWTWDKKSCEITRVESTGTAASNGGTAVNRSNALLRACDNARANVRHWFREEVLSDRITKTVAESVEKSGSTESQNGTAGAGVGNSSNRTNNNDTKYQITHTIRVQASGHLEGFRVVNQKVVGDQEVSCTIQWDEGNNRNLDKFRASM